ncbi:hypothetical protein K466DRAFT_80566 [Polyporus arcularius HHB13444]|uniref:Uncharacterized protein n=1 Tax=Polyporus arcularius HHB13444 TaxID=1314778 RepID=A0A5C3Q5D1_9APHY|nr:hypothetical protein K466DRAFT_80566 [Polyporus arcularius HHB13444]
MRFGRCVASGTDGECLRGRLPSSVLRTLRPWPIHLASARDSTHPRIWSRPSLRRGVKNRVGDVRVGRSRDVLWCRNEADQWQWHFQYHQRPLPAADCWSLPWLCAHQAFILTPVCLSFSWASGADRLASRGHGIRIIHTVSSPIRAYVCVRIAQILTAWQLDSSGTSVSQATRNDQYTYFGARAL